MRRRSGHLLCALILAMSAFPGAACNAPGQPTYRFGSLPFPGLSLYTRADPDRLGEHRYWSPARFADGEVGRGIMYTQHAGFLDVSHIRDAADWARYFAIHVEPALEQREASLTLGGPDRSRMHMHFNYPAGWDDLPTWERQRLIHDLALRCGQEASYALWTWHEIITWYGHQTVPLVSESPSSFTYDDVMSHVIGMYVVERAWNDEWRDYDEAMTVALDEVIHELAPATPEQTADAVDSVRGHWWRRGQSLKRHLDVGLDDGEVAPMLIAGFEVEGAGPAFEAPAHFPLPQVRDIEVPGMDFDEFLVLELESRSRAYPRLRAHLPGAPRRIMPDRDIPLLVAQVKREMQKEYGPAVDSPGDYPPEVARPAALRAKPSRG